MSNNIVNLSDASFDEIVLKASGPVLVDFWAAWCGPCKLIAPILDALAPEYQGKLTIAKLNIDEQPNTAPKFGIRSIPTLLLFKEGQIVATQIGAVTKAELKVFLDTHL